MFHFIDTHAHIDGEEFATDRDDMINRAKAAGASQILVPAVDLKSVDSVLQIARRYAGYALPMIGLHPEEVGTDWENTLQIMRDILDNNLNCAETYERFIAIGEVGLDYYWSREFETEQLKAFERQIEWSVATRLPLMIHCRKAQNEMVRLMRHYQSDLAGGVFHCFTGNIHEAEELLQFDGFALGIGGVVTFKKSNLPEVVAQIPLDRIVVETDAPYMAPVPHRGKRNESAFVVNIIEKIAECKGTTTDDIALVTTQNAKRIFRLTDNRPKT